MRRLILLVLIGLLASCAVRARTVHRGPPAHAPAYGVRYTEFYYYPYAEVYFNPVTKIYVFYQNGIWRYDKRTPATIVSLDLFVRVVDNKGTPWVRHRHFKDKYPKTHFKKPPKHKSELKSKAKPERKPKPKRKAKSKRKGKKK